MQEIGDLLANRLTNDEEDAVQEELKALQVEAVGTSYHTSFHDPHLGLMPSLDKQSLKCAWSCPLHLARCHFYPQKVRAVQHCYVVTILIRQQRSNEHLPQLTESGLPYLVNFPFCVIHILHLRPLHRSY